MSCRTTARIDILTTALDSNQTTDAIRFAQLLETDPDGPLSVPQRENVRDILHAGHHQLELVDEVLDLSRVESGRLELRMAAIAPAPLIPAAALPPSVGVSCFNPSAGWVRKWDRSRVQESDGSSPGASSLRWVGA